MNDGQWLATNQRLLVAEFARLKAQIVGEDTTLANGAIAEARAAMSSPATIDLVSDAFGLSNFERDILLLSAGVEMDGALAAACAQDVGSAGLEASTFGIALAKLPEPHWSALLPVSPLRRWRLLELREDENLCSSRLRIEERVLHFLAGLNYLDPRLQPLLCAREAKGLHGESHGAIVDAAVRTLQDQRHTPLVQLHGNDLASHREAAGEIARRLGFALYAVRAADIPASAREMRTFTQLWTREALLLRAALIIESVDTDAAHLARCTRDLGGLVFVVGPQPVPLERPELRIALDSLPRQDQKQLWRRALRENADRLNGALDTIATKFRVGADVMERAAEDVRGAPHRDARTVEAIVLRSCRDSIRQRLDGLAERIEPAATWKDLVLPDAQLAMLREIAAHVRRRTKVYEEWGFARACGRGLGISALFAGESGTGKTMAAEVLAGELEIDLYRIDLASMVSKYIGETEKNLRKVFDAAEDGTAILLFDEADALFGKRSEVNDSHDRFANIEVSYLLQRMEAYRGLAILTTNLKGALDAAFQRRLRFVVQFPFPDAALRERIWRQVFPAGAPTRSLDHSRLAQLNVPGGSIRNIAMNAAFLAAESDVPIDMEHLLKAARSESAKRERPYSGAETRGWA